MRSLYVLFFVFASYSSADADTPSNSKEYAYSVAMDRSIVLPPAPDEKGVGSTFGGDGDKWIGGRMACAPHDYVNKTDHVCAHRSHPCGTILIIEYPQTGLRSWCIVADRGPYGANVFASDGKTKLKSSDGSYAWYIKIKNSDSPPAIECPTKDCIGKWRGILDISPAVTKDLGHPGWGPIRVWTLGKIINYQKYLSSKKQKPVI